ncbi:YbaN family protein [Marinicella gelatinilytica]|uniref:YbaN family protein n=1 Tax=Marinicella gelatinilytica TaxID=2996017 RepID=UPI002260D80A|nr:YbaN family protein [Marinicella gelatinilytica]MCX7544859.1 YbaN family protein [Marinicella gelatinilytica]
MKLLPQAKWFYWLIAVLALVLGLIGVVLPLLPTTPFLIVALWAASRCSPRLANWLENHPRLGPVLRNWRDHRAIPTTAKVLACVMMSLSFGVVWYRGASTTVLVIVFMVIISLMAYILSKPSK